MKFEKRPQSWNAARFAVYDADDPSAVGIFNGMTEEVAEALAMQLNANGWEVWPIIEAIQGGSNVVISDE